MASAFEVLLTTAELCLIKLSEGLPSPDVIDDILISTSFALNFLCSGVIEVNFPLFPADNDALL